jgi:hypothetical protein
MKLSEKQKFYFVLFILIFALLPISLLESQTKFIWLPAWYGWLGGILGGLLTCQSLFTLDFKKAVFSPTEKHWAYCRERIVRGAILGSAFVAILHNNFDTIPAQISAGLIAGQYDYLFFKNKNLVDIL